MSRKLILSALMMCSAFLTAGIVAPGGAAYTEIVIAADAPGFIQVAANDLAKYIGKTCGAELQVVAEYHGQSPAIFVGNSPYVAEQGVTADGLDSEGYRIVSTDKHLIILGRDYDGHPITVPERHPWRPTEIWAPNLSLCLFGEQGSMNGVYAFLKKYVGCRWYMPGDLGEVIQPVETLGIPAFEESDAPVFSQRYIYISYAGLHEEDLLFLRRNGQGGLSPYYSMHSFYLLKKHLEDHPDYFALIDGQRDTGGLSCLDGQPNLCLSNPDVVQAFAEIIRQGLDSHPGLKSFPVFPNDGMVRICECEACQAQIDNEAPSVGRFSNYVWGFVCKVAEEVKKTHPDCIIANAGYEYYKLPPSRIDKFPDNVGVQLVYHRDQNLSPSYRNLNFEAFEGWKSRTHHLFSWVHYLQNNGAWRGVPVGSPDNLQRDFRFLKALGVWEGEFIEAEGADIYKLNNPGMSHWKIYLTMKAHWNPDFDFNGEMEEYYRLFYGPAAEDMKTFWTTAFAANNAAGDATAKQSLVPEDVYDVSVLEKMHLALETAQTKVSPDSLYAQRIGMVNEEFQFARKTLMGYIQEGPKKMELPFAFSKRAFEKLPFQRFVSRYGSPYSPNTWVRAAHDDKDLILQFCCYETPDHPIVRKAQPLTPRPAGSDANDIWSDDFIEFYLGTDKDSDECLVQFAINPNGAVWDARYGLGLFSPAWTSETLRTETLVEDGRWMLTVRLALTELDYDKLKENDTVKVNFYRGRYEAGKGLQNNLDYSCWSPVFDPYNHCPHRFGSFIWKN